VFSSCGDIRRNDSNVISKYVTVPASCGECDGRVCRDAGNVVWSSGGDRGQVLPRQGRPGANDFILRVQYIHLYTLVTLPAAVQDSIISYFSA
jgi:hypothetical protein